LTVLLVIGLLHMFLVWNGDILTEYALAGFIVLPFLFGPRWLLAAGGMVGLVIYLIMPLLPAPVSLPQAAWMTNHIAQATRTYGTGGFLDVLAFRIQELPFIFPLHVLVFPRTIALFLFGVLTWRIGILRRASTDRGLLFGMMLAGILIGLGLTLAAEGQVLFGWPPLGRGQFLVERLATVVLASGYGAAVLGLMSFSGGRRMLAWAAPLGRMAFTNYLAQSLIFGCIFYGYGLGLFGRIGAAAALAIGIVVYVAQVIFSTCWLGHYRFGPIEWLWRSLMYGVPQRMHQH
jgi:uncharacterized protein